MSFNLGTDINILKDVVALKVPTNPTLASNLYSRIVSTINQFEENMSEHLITGGRLVSFHDDTFSIDDVGYKNPDMIIFYGTKADWSKVQLLQHISQLSLLLQAVPRSDKTSPRRKIGFVPNTQAEE